MPPYLKKKKNDCNPFENENHIIYNEFHCANVSNKNVKHRNEEKNTFMEWLFFVKTCTHVPRVL